jgi:hypothetical protein
MQRHQAVLVWSCGVCTYLQQLLHQFDLVRSCCVVQSIPAIIIELCVQLQLLNGCKLLSRGLLQAAATAAEQQQLIARVHESAESFTFGYSPAVILGQQL